MTQNIDDAHHATERIAVDPARYFVRRSLTHQALALGSTMLWGVIELMALARRHSRRVARTQRIAH